MTTNPEKPEPEEDKDIFTVENIVDTHFVDDEEVVDAPSSPEGVVTPDGTADKPEAPEEAEEYSPLSDDEKWLAGDDAVLGSDDDSALIKQPEGTVRFHIEGLYNDKGKTHHQLYLRENPPIMIVEGSDGEFASFIITREFSRLMSTQLEDTRKAYYGIGRTRGEARSFTEKFKGVPQWASDNKGKAAFLALMIVALVFLMIVV